VRGKRDATRREFRAQAPHGVNDMRMLHRNSLKRSAHRARVFAFATLALIAAALAPSLLAQTFVDKTTLNTNGYDVIESAVGADAFGGAVGTAADPRDADAVYYYDGLAIRRFDFQNPGQATGTIVFTPPAPPVGTIVNSQGAVYGTFIVFDPFDKEVMYFAESSERKLYRITIDATNRSLVSTTQVVYTSPVGTSLYDIGFDVTVSPYRMIFSHSDVNADNNLLKVDYSAVPFVTTPIAIIAGASGCLDFDPAGNFYYIFPENSGSVTTAQQAKIVSWTAAQFATAFTGGQQLSVANMLLHRTIAFSGVFKTIASVCARTEGGATVLYAGNSDTASIMRIDISQPNGSNDDVHAVDMTVPGVVPGKLAFSSKTAGFTANDGQYDDTGSAANARGYVVTVSYGASTTATLAQILPLNDITEAKTLAVISGPAAEHIGVQFAYGVEVRDGGGARILTGAPASAAIVATLASGPAGAVLVGNLNQTAVNGLATFTSMQLDTAGSYSINFTMTGGPTVIKALEGNQIGEIIFTATPAGIGLNKIFSLGVALRDANHALITTGSGATSTVTVAILTGPTGATLTGGTSVSAAGGVATFAGLKVDREGEYVLRVQSFNSVTADTPALSALANVSLNGSGGRCAMDAAQDNSLWGAALVLLALAGALALRLRTSRPRE
jgi:hypothetical protein